MYVVMCKSRAIQTKQNAESMKARRDRKQTMCRHPNYKIPTATQGRVGPRITMVFVTVLDFCHQLAAKNIKQKDSVKQVVLVHEGSHG
ncbi:hypothetical protein IMY05_016G0048200 [Salix suchowensis]|nr:hypothetical protein IMY05_016G0048200 [Salix suchowensis]